MEYKHKRTKLLLDVSSMMIELIKVEENTSEAR